MRALLGVGAGFWTFGTDRLDGGDLPARLQRFSFTPSRAGCSGSPVPIRRNIVQTLQGRKFLSGRRYQAVSGGSNERLHLTRPGRVKSAQVST